MVVYLCKQSFFRIHLELLTALCLHATFAVAELLKMYFHLFPVGGDNANLFGGDFCNALLGLCQEQLLQVVNYDIDF